MCQNKSVLLAGVLAFATLASSLALFRDRRFADAEKSFRQILVHNPADADARLYLARTLIELNRAADAVGELEKLLSTAVDPDVRFRAGKVFQELGERRMAQLEIVAPDSAATLELAGERLEWTGQLDEALRLYTEAAKREPARPGVHYRVGNVLWRKREIPAANNALQKELSLTPQHGMANMRMGQIHLNTDDAAQALPYLQRAVAAMPSSTEARRELGKALRKSGRPQEARSEWEQVAKLRPNDDQVFYLLGSLYRELGEAELAAKALQQHRTILERRRDRPREP